MPIQARTEFAAALNQLASEKGVDVSTVIEAIEQAALAAYRKDLSLRGETIPEDFDSLTAKVDSVTGGISIYRDDQNITPPGFARIAAQTAKQVIMQRLNEAEKGAIMEEYEKKIGTVISGVIQRQDMNTYYVDLGRAEGVFPASEQVRGEYYYLTQRMKFFIKEIREGRRGGPEVVVSRTDAGLVKGLFTAEVPELASGSVVVKDLAREAGSRTKIAVASIQEGVDPVGSLVGQKGVRVQAVINELGEEKIDVISYSEDPARFVAAALSPAKDVQVTLKEDGEERIAKVKVADSQLSLAIGKGGQNVRLAAKLTGWKIDIEGTGEGTGEVKEGISKTPADLTAQVLKEADEAIEAGEQPIPTDETASLEGRSSAVEKVAAEIDQATSEEAIVNDIEPEPTTEEAAAAVATAEADIAEEDAKSPKGEELKSMEETPDTQRGDLVGDREPSSEEISPVETVETGDISPKEEKFQEPKEDSDQNKE